jgi:hypothetical protein
MLDDIIVVKSLSDEVSRNMNKHDDFAATGLQSSNKAEALMVSFTYRCRLDYLQSAIPCVGTFLNALAAERC